MLGVVHLLYLQGLLAADNDQRLRNRQTKHFIRGEDGSFADAGGLPVFRRIIGDAPGTQLLGFTGH